MDEDRRKPKKSRTFQQTWLRDHTWLRYEKGVMFCFFVGNLRRQTPLLRQKGVQILEPQLCNDIKTVKNMRMLLMKKLRGICSATHSVFLERNRKPSSQQREPSTGWPQGGYSDSQVRLTAQFFGCSWPRKCIFQWEEMLPIDLIKVLKVCKMLLLLF